MKYTLYGHLKKCKYVYLGAVAATGAGRAAGPAREEAPHCSSAAAPALARARSQPQHPVHNISTASYLLIEITRSATHLGHTKPPSYKGLIAVFFLSF